MASAAEEAADVLNRGEGDDGQEKHHATQMDEPFDAGPDALSAAGGFDQNEDEPAAIKAGKGKHVEYTEVEADERDEREQVVGSCLGGTAGTPSDADGPR